MANPCHCMECRIRAAIWPNPVEGDASPVNMNELLKALISIAGECLAHGDYNLAKRVGRELIEAREQWLTHPRVIAQNTPQGHG